MERGEIIYNISKLLIVLGILSSIAFNIFLTYKTIELKAENRWLSGKLDNFEMFYTEKYKEELSLKQNETVMGIAFGNFISVWTRGKTITEVLEICTHEYAHNNLGLKDP